MSSTSFRKPDFRLDLGYSAITLARDGEAIAIAEPGGPGFAADFRALATDVRSGGGRLTVVLPEPEVWRARLALPGGTRLARRRAARRAAAAGLGAAPGAIAVVLGARDPDGATPVAAVRRNSLAEARALLAGVGLRPAAILGAGDFPGFPAAPRLDGWRLPTLRRRALSLGGGAVAAAAVALALWPETPAPLPPDPAPAPLVVTAPPPVAPPVLSDLRPRPAPPLRITRSDPPPVRPKPTQASRVTVATRSVPLTFIAPRLEAPAELRLAELTTARARMVDAEMATPLRRPIAAPKPAAAATAATVTLKPLPRPAPAEAAPAPVVAAAAALERPHPRPDARGAVVVASLAPVEQAPAALAATLRPAARPAPAAKAAAAPAKPKVVAPQQVAKAAPKVVAPRPVAAKATPAKPVVVRQVAQPTRQVVTPVRQKVVVRRAPAAAKPVVRTASVAKPVVKTASVAKPVSSAPAKATATREKVGLSRSGVSLIGVFGGADGRHALVRLPNGSIERVSAGDRIQGVQVAAVGADSVRLSGRGRDTLLRLPD